MIDQLTRGGSGRSRADDIILCSGASDPPAGHALFLIHGGGYQSGSIRYRLIGFDQLRRQSGGAGGRYPAAGQRVGVSVGESSVSPGVCLQVTVTMRTRERSARRRAHCEPAERHRKETRKETLQAS